MSKGTSHPNIAKLVRQIEIIDAYYMNDHIYDAWRAMLVLLRGLKPKHKGESSTKSLIKSLDYAAKRVDSLRVRNYPDAHFKRATLARQLDKDFQSRFMDVLWAANMLSDGGYSFFVPAGKKDSDTVEIKKGDRNTTSIR